MHRKGFSLAAWTRLLRTVFLLWLLLGACGMLAEAAAQVADGEAHPASVARIEFWNRSITFQRGTLAGATAQDRADRAVDRLEHLPLNVDPSEITLRPIKIENQDGFGVACRGNILFFLGTNDLDKESGETLEQAAQSALRNIAGALQARSAERSWPVIRSGLVFAVLGFFLTILLCVAIWKIHTRVVSLLHRREGSFPLRWRLFGFNLLPYVAAIVYSITRTLAFGLTLVLIYLWVTLSLRRFPYTEPWGEEAGSYVLELLRNFALSAVYALPGLLTVAMIFLVARWIVRFVRGLLEQLATSRLSVSWMDADVARATQRIVVAILWIFAVILAYPYIPGSHTEAFKGITVLLGLVVSLGSTGIINQIMSGLFVVYSRALKTGEWVRVNDTEGEVLEVGLLAAKIRTIEGQEVTIPNSVLVGTSTINYTRLGFPDGMVISSTVTIGYDAPWRQVHALLVRAAATTANVRKQPEPYVLQRQLSDFYVEYTLIARLDDEKKRIETISDLHAHIQDSFNEFGVQIMSPHYMVQPEGNVSVPRAKWFAPPSPPQP